MYSEERTRICQWQMEADVSSEEMEATNLEATLEATQATMEQQDLFKGETYFDTIGSLEHQNGNQCLVMRHRQGEKKWMQDSVGSRQKSSAA
jgi:aspartate carbamoyltransferase catalytic subunit